MGSMKAQIPFPGNADRWVASMVLKHLVLELEGLLAGDTAALVGARERGRGALFLYEAGMLYLAEDGSRMTFPYESLTEYRLARFPLIGRRWTFGFLAGGQLYMFRRIRVRMANNISYVMVMKRVPKG